MRQLIRVRTEKNPHLSHFEYIEQNDLQNGTANQTTPPTDLTVLVPPQRESLVSVRERSFPSESLHGYISP